MALGYTSSTIISVLYSSDAQYWSGLARAGIYPLPIAGVFTGLLMIYGWIRLTVMFFQSDQLISSWPSSVTVATEKSLLDDAEEGIWPPPPIKPV